MAMVNPFDLKTALLAKHAQHVVLIHFPIALFLAAVAFDFIALWTKRRGIAETAYYNLLGAAISTIPVLATGILAWQFQLEGQNLKGILLLHLVLACVSTVMIWLVWWLHFRARRRTVYLPGYRLALELLAVAVVAVTGHLGGFLSGVNAPGGEKFADGTVWILNAGLSAPTPAITLPNSDSGSGSSVLINGKNPSWRHCGQSTESAAPSRCSTPSSSVQLFLMVPSLDL
jgi:uncharacterized membrane protein